MIESQGPWDVEATMGPQAKWPRDIAEQAARGKGSEWK